MTEFDWRPVSYFSEHQALTRWLALLHRLPLPGRMRRVADGLTRILFSADISCASAIPTDVVFLHNGLGTVVHPDVRFDGAAVIGQHVTLGLAFNGRAGVPTIGHEVMIGTGAVVLGPITIGTGSVVAANAVVTRHVPPGSLAAGVPARCQPLDDALPELLFGPIRSNGQATASR